MRRIRILLCCTLAALAGRALADEELDTLLAEYRKAEAAWYQELEKSRAGDADAAIDFSSLPPHPAGEFLPRFKIYADDHSGEPAAIDALGWIIDHVPRVPGQPKWARDEAAAALKRVERNHAAQPEIARLLPRLRYGAWYHGRQPIVGLFERVIDQNKDHGALAAARFGLACILYDGPPADGGDPEADRKRAIELFQLVRKEHQGTPEAEQAAGYLFEIENLQIGMKAPDFEGEDADGRKLRLSQFHGQVVVIDFWGFW